MSPLYKKRPPMKMALYASECMKKDQQNLVIGQGRDDLTWKPYYTKRKQLSS